MAKKNNKEKNIDNDNRIKLSIISWIIFVLGLISFLSILSLAGSFGVFLDRSLSLGFGWGKWLFPVFLVVLSLALYRRQNFFSKKSNYIGLSLFFVFLLALFHFFFESSISLEKAKDGVGGGYLGYGLSYLLNSIFGFWGGLLIILAIMVLAVILLFNITLSELFFIRKIKIKKPQILSAKEKEIDSVEVEEEVPDLNLESEELVEEVLFSKKEIGAKEEKKEKIEKPQWKTKGIKTDLPLDLLSSKKDRATSGDINKNSLIIQRTLENFGISVEMGDVSVGPTVTQYTFKPSEGIKLSRITSLNNDLSLALAAHPIRIEAPIPGQALVGIEVPNKAKAIIGLREILEDDSFKNRSSNLMAALGKDVSGCNIIYDISKMPHLLVAGATNSGKSVCLNTIIVSLLYQNSPESLRFIMVDPKRVELPVYNGIPHLLTPVITEVSKTINALRWCLNEMDRRYELLNQAGKKNIQSYNQSSNEKLPYIIFIIDELADLMVAAAKDIEASVIRLTQMSRAVGIHLILATQRPSVDVITGLIKANTPSRIAFFVASAVDSKTILDSSGAEKLLGKGDMLFSTAELSKPKRIQGAYVDDNEILNITNYLKDKYGPVDYLEGIVERQKVSGIGGVGLDGLRGDEDELLEEAKDIVISSKRASTSLLQRRLRIGYSRAASILDMLEEAGIVGPPNGSKPREILVSAESNLAGASLHKREESEAPDRYLYEEEESPLVLDEEEPPEDEEEEEDIARYYSR
jgi:S-DNA-T family DNA segregation ATPase FtsK/SpoIIIE